MPSSMSASPASFCFPNDPKPMTVRFDIINLFDTIYFIRDGSGIGVFAPQYGPRRGYFARHIEEVRRYIGGGSPSSGKSPNADL